jgi:hypothetical protein
MAKKLKVQEIYVPKVDTTIYIYIRHPLRLFPVPWRSMPSIEAINQIKKIIKNVNP